MNSNEYLTSELLREILTASTDRKAVALRALRGASSGETSSGPLLYTPKQAVELLSVSRSTLWRLVRAGRLTRVEIMPGFFRITRASLVALAGGEL